MWGVSYWIFPVISALCWLGMIMGLLIHWNVDGKPHYASMDPTQTIAYISDVGAQSLKPLFIAGSVVTTIFLDLSFLSERWLRHNGRLVANTSLFQKVLSWLSMFFAGVGTVGLICLSIFDTLRHPTLHDLFLLLFIVGYVISAIFICWEYQRLGIHFRQHRVLRNSFWIKLTFILVEVALAVAFAVCSFNGKYNPAAVLEWAVSFVFTFYVLSFIYDLAPAVKTRGAPLDRQTALGLEANDPEARTVEMHGGNARFTADSDRTLVGNEARSAADAPKPAVGRNF